MAKVLVIGSGGREHALCYKFAQSPYVEQVYVANGNGGMDDVATLVDIDILDFEGLIAFAKENKIDLTFVGPEIPLCAGISDAFQKAGLSIFGPTQAASQLEGSKCFAKDMMHKYNIPTAKYASFDDYEKASVYLSNQKCPIVLKADGLAAGKGVIIATTMEEAQKSLKDMMCNDLFKEAGTSLVIEEYLEGEEFSLFAFVNGKDVYPMQIAQDHKRAFDHDQGLNTGGMGAYTPVAHLPQSAVDEAMEKVMKPIAEAMVLEGMPYQGVLYGGFMLTDEGVKTIEFNCRFGDPESEVVLQAMTSDLYQTIMDVMDHKEPVITFSKEAFLGVVLAAEGYPQSYQKNIDLSDLKLTSPACFHMGTKKTDKGLVSSGGRVLFISQSAPTLKEAKQKTYALIDEIKREGLFYRSDIGDRELSKETD